jgi:uncharacterized RDD family membrane protein YckC
MRLFNRVTIRTPESVELEFVLAGIGNRVLGLVVDYLIWGAALIGILLAWGVISAQLPRYFRVVRQFENLGLWVFAISLLLVFAVYTGYFTYFETLWQGQTPGKRYAKIRVIQDDGQPAGLSQAVLRSLLRPIDDLLFLGALMIILGQREKRIGDWLAGTIVVQEEHHLTDTTITIAADAQSLADQLLASANIRALRPDDFATIREYLQRRQFMEESAKAALSLQLAKQARHLMDLQELPFKMSPDLLLEGVYLAYQQQPTDW